ncbi:MAG: hypothetical protein ACOX6V_00030 [Patescibacteria group bacterium]|jgi:hypothetical protein
MKKLLVVCIWLPVTLLTLVFTLGYTLTYNTRVQVTSSETETVTLSTIPYKFYTSLPKVLGAKTINAFYVSSQDVIPELVYNYLKKHKSPMLSTSNDLVMAARKYDLDPLFLVAVAQCESNLGKKMPENCHNPFGWGIHSRGTLCFDTWQEGYQTVAKGLRDKYFDKGLENPEDIMAKYTPPALEKNGSWAKCVNHFLGKLNETKNQM